MKWKLLQLVILVAFVWVAHLFWVNWIQPDMTTDIAMQQFEDDARPAIAMRSLSNNQWPVLSIIFVLGVVVIFWPGWEKVKEYFQDDKS